MFVFYFVFKRKGKNVRMFLKNNVLKNLRFLFVVEKIEVVGRIDEKFDVFVLFDIGEFERIGIENIENCYLKLINIDYYVISEGIGDLYYINFFFVVIGEIIYQIVKLMGIDNDREIVICFYISIFIDIGGFKYLNIILIIYQIVGDLINIGIDFVYIINKVFDEMSFLKFNFLKDVLQILEFFEGNKIVFLIVIREMLKKNGVF